MPRHVRGEHRSRSRPASRARRLEVTRLEARQMLSADAFWLVGPDAPAEAPYQFATDYDQGEKLVVMVAPYDGDDNASPVAEGKAVEQFVLNALTVAAPKSHEGGVVALLDATGEIDDQSLAGIADQSAVDPAAVAPVSYAPDHSLTAHDVSAILQAARTDLASDGATSPSDVAKEDVPEAIVIVREPDGALTGVGVVFTSAAYQDQYDSDADGDGLWAASLTLATANPHPAENVAAATSFDDDAAEGDPVAITSAAAGQMVEADADTPESAGSESGRREFSRSESEVFFTESDIPRATAAARSASGAAGEPRTERPAPASSSHAKAAPAVHDKAREALFASLAENAGNFGAWLQLYALPRNLVSLENAIQSLLAECEDVDQAIGNWLLEPGAQPWLEWATVALVAAEAARRRSRRQHSEMAACARDAEQLLHLFPELFGLAYGA